MILNSADREDLEFVRLLCTRLGIGTYGITTQLREGSGARAVRDPPVHFVNEDLPEDFFLLRSTATVPRGQEVHRRGWVVQSVEPTDGSRRCSARRSRTVTRSREDNILTGNCFGCQAGGDVITFLMQIDGLAFAEAVERLADKYGVQLRREEGDVRRGPPAGSGPGG